MCIFISLYVAMCHLALVGPLGPLWAGHLFGSLGPCGQALIGRDLVRPWALMGWALMGPMGPYGPGTDGHPSQ